MDDPLTRALAEAEAVAVGLAIGRAWRQARSGTGVVLTIDGGWHQQRLMAAAAGPGLPAAFVQSWFNPGLRRSCRLPEPPGGSLDLDLAWQLLDQGTLVVGVRASHLGLPMVVRTVRLAGQALTLDQAGDPPEWVTELGSDFAEVSASLQAGLCLEVEVGGQTVTVGVG